MKGLTTEQKEQVRSALLAYCDNFPTRNRAAESLQNVSSATVSQLINGKYELISDDMFTRIAVQIGFSFDSWTLHEGKTFREITYAFADAQAYRNVTWVVGDAGCGKTTAAIEYRRTHRNVFYILCSEDMRRSDFVREMAKQVGAPTDTTNLRDMLENAISMIAFLSNPLLIFDEGDKLTDSVFNYFISIYNRLEGHAGIVFLSTDYIKRRIENGLRYNKKGYKEINSRIGRRFYEVSATEQNDIYAICQANSLTDRADIEEVLKDAKRSENDLRRVKRCIHARKRMIEARNRKGGSNE
ncbi:ATP-binding protein [Phocaeicola barnesiae]|jgi:DNA transposition AAA+ family ATPase|uniref:ATP-binding protein n=1 Tax=Phocaeicola barnesiae TaxID=376804 RepID=UPI0015A98CA3|nr:ATP-binding protein [Phocaeicola barnesiae]MDM8240657.1 ATP-binding protein [Phocaeicola barnesiae]